VMGVSRAMVEIPPGLKAYRVSVFDRTA